MKKELSFLLSPTLGIIKVFSNNLSRLLPIFTVLQRPRRKANKSEGFHLYPKSILHLGNGKKIQYMKKSGQSLARISVSFRFHRLTFTPK